MKKVALIMSLPAIFITISILNKPIFSNPDTELIADLVHDSEKKQSSKEIQPVINEYDNILTSEINISGTVGAAVAITYKNEIAFLKCYGVKKTGENDSIDENTIFRLASVSKTITGLLAGILDEKNLISLDERVVDCIPGFRLKSNNNTQNITIRNLLSHTTGLIPHAYDNMVEDMIPLRSIMNVLNKVDISAAPGKIYGYQNVMFGLFDTIVNVKTSKKYSELVREEIFDPYGMKNASTDFQSFKSNNNKAFPHAGANGAYRCIRLNDRYYTTASAAGVNASISDMAQYLLVLLGDPGQDLPGQVYQTVFTPQIETHLSNGYFRQWDMPESVHYGIGWRLLGYKGRKIAYHGGYVNGYKAEIAVCRDENIGIVYLTNSPNSVASKSIPCFLDLYFRFINDTHKITSIGETATPKELS